jgi:hypothetical protein
VGLVVAAAAARVGKGGACRPRGGGGDERPDEDGGCIYSLLCDVKFCSLYSNLASHLFGQDSLFIFGYIPTD